MIVWLIGMSGSGKTTVGSEMVRILNGRRGPGGGPPWVLVDGDAVRVLMGSDLTHSVEDRRVNSDRIVRLCSFLDGAGLNAVACVLSIFPDQQLENRVRFSSYRQVYIDVNYEILKRRDNKAIYEQAERGEIDNVVGVDIPFPQPVENDVVLDNSRDGVAPVELATTILDELGFDTAPIYRFVRPDLIDRPEMYQYTEYEGSSFLAAYRANRERALESLQARLLNLWKSCPYPTGRLTRPALAAELLRAGLAEIPGRESDWIAWLDSELLPEDYRDRYLSERELSRSMVMREFLISKLDAMLVPGWDSAQYVVQLTTLIQRFEVGKRVYVHCDKDTFRRIDPDYSDLMNYPLLHALLSYSYAVVPERKQPILINALLKLGDILASSVERFVTPGQLVLSYSCLRAELALIKDRFGV